MHGWTVVSKAFSSGPGTQAALRTCYDYVHTIPSPQGQLISLSHLSSRDGNQELTTEPQPRVATWYTGERGPCACLASELSGSQLPSAAPPPPPKYLTLLGRAVIIAKSHCPRVQPGPSPGYAQRRWTVCPRSSSPRELSHGFCRLGLVYLSPVITLPGVASHLKIVFLPLFIGISYGQVLL